MSDKSRLIGGRQALLAQEASRTRTCPAKGCDADIIRYRSWTPNRSMFCDYTDRHVHTHCDGTVPIVDIGGTDLCVCQCMCHEQANP